MVVAPALQFYSRYRSNFKKGVGSFMDLVSSRSILAAIVNGEENPETLAELSQGKLKNKMEQFPSAAHLCS
ncbi:hypothetical protein J2S24_000535 [Thermoanaerobacter pentosaceus]|jgi:hypothetical protein|uniref:Uncharacterized protein n=1 Tax=Thermoanaerobacter pentosaceus TaxID=694059 RepID=A0ABT9M1S5_9THEO|nr:hypothetical protein [Thermoanaerobacter pentosaceus]